MAETQPHRAAFMNLMVNERESRAFLLGYLMPHCADELLCSAIQAWRAHEAAMADLEKVAPEPDERF